MKEGASAKHVVGEGIAEPEDAEIEDADGAPPALPVVAGWWRVVGPHLGMALVGSLFGGLNVVVTWAFAASGTTEAGSVIFSLYRGAGAFVLLLIAQLVLRRQIDLPQSWRDAGLLALLGMFGVFGNQMLFLLGLQATDANTAAIMQPAIAVFAVLIAMAFRLEPLDWPHSCLSLFNHSMRKFLGVALAVLGTLVMAGVGDVHLNSNVVGLVFLTGNTFSYAAFVCLQKLVLGRYHPVTISMYTFFFGSICNALFCTQYLRDLSAFALPRPNLYALVYCWLAADVAGTVIQMWANSFLDASVCALYQMMQPVATAVLSYAFLHADPNVSEAIGAALIVEALLMCTLRFAACDVGSPPLHVHGAPGTPPANAGGSRGDAGHSGGQTSRRHAPLATPLLDPVV